MQDPDRPVLSIITGHWLGMIGGGLATVAGFTWLLALPTQIRGHASNPYIGILLFVILPILFAFGLILMPIGAWLARRRIRQGLAQAVDRPTSLRRLVIFLGVATMLNVLIMSHLTYRAVEHMETAQFCGQSCHVMKPEFTAHQGSPHAHVLCVECHVAPGASGWVAGKMAGTRQLMETVFNTFPRPIKSAMETNRLVPASQTCEKCHWPDKFYAAKLRVIPDYADDETNTLTQSVLTMMIGGGNLGGIHGKHFGPGISIRYAPKELTRQTIPWIEYKDSARNVNRVYLANDSKLEEVEKLQRFEMQCVDCHNRPTHTFELPEKAINRALIRGEIPTTLPFAKKKAVEVLKAEYASSDDAAQKIPAAIKSYYQQSHPGVYPSRVADVEAAANAILAIYNRNVFPDLKVTWGTYVNNLGHTDYPGCFRCHDEAHTSSDKTTITQDCSVCHQLIAASEASPDILKSLGLDERISKAQKK